MNVFDLYFSGAMTPPPPPPKESGEKQCIRCQQVKPLSSFHRAGHGYRAACGQCVNDKRKGQRAFMKL